MAEKRRQAGKIAPAHGGRARTMRALLEDAQRKLRKLTPPATPPDAIATWHNALAENGVTPTAFELIPFDNVPHVVNHLYVRFEHRYADLDAVTHEMLGRRPFLHVRVRVFHDSARATSTLTWLPDANNHAMVELGGLATPVLSIRAFLIEAEQLVMGESRAVALGNKFVGTVRNPKWEARDAMATACGHAWADFDAKGLQ